MSSGWDILQFRTEVGDEQEEGAGKIDLAPRPCGTTSGLMGGVRLQYDICGRLECKRLPNYPKTKTGRNGNNDNGEREYVFSQYSATGVSNVSNCRSYGPINKIGAAMIATSKMDDKSWHERINSGYF